MSSPSNCPTMAIRQAEGALKNNDKGRMNELLRYPNSKGWRAAISSSYQMVCWVDTAGGGVFGHYIHTCTDQRPKCPSAQPRSWAVFVQHVFQAPSSLASCGLPDGKRLFVSNGLHGNQTPLLAVWLLLRGVSCVTLASDVTGVLLSKCQSLVASPGLRCFNVFSICVCVSIISSHSPARRHGKKGHGGKETGELPMHP